MQLIRTIPLFFVILILYNVVVVLFSTEENPAMEKTLHTFVLPSGEDWELKMKDAFIVFGLVVLYVEILKSTKSTAATIVDHTLSTFVFIAYIIEFLMAPPVAQSTFLILGVMSMVDVLAGFTITIASARRDFQVGSG